MWGCRDLWARMPLCCHASRQALNECYSSVDVACSGVVRRRLRYPLCLLISAIGLPSLVLEVGTAQATAISCIVFSRLMSHDGAVHIGDDSLKTFVQCVVHPTVLGSCFHSFRAKQVHRTRVAKWFEKARLGKEPVTRFSLRGYIYL